MFKSIPAICGYDRLQLKKEMHMKRIILATCTALSLMISITPASAANCYDLWYERNQIFDDNGFCFKSRLGKDTFDNSDCYTDNPQMSRAEERRIAQIKAQERKKGCKVNN
jgi:YARHG domain